MNDFIFLTDPDEIMLAKIYGTWPRPKHKIHYFCLELDNNVMEQKLKEMIKNA